LGIFAKKKPDKRKNRASGARLFKAKSGGEIVT